MPSEYRAYITSHEAGSPRSPDVSARKDHLVRCPECGEALDMRDLRKVLKHLHLSSYLMPRVDSTPLPELAMTRSALAGDLSAAAACECGRSKTRLANGYEIGAAGKARWRPALQFFLHQLD